MNTTPSQERAHGFGLAFAGAAVHTLLISALLAFGIWRVPYAKQAFDEYGMTISWATQIVIGLSTSLADNWQVVTPVLPLLPVIDFALIHLLGRCSRSLPLGWVGCFAVFLLAVGSFVLLGIEVPMMKLRDALAR